MWMEGGENGEVCGGQTAVYGGKDHTKEGAHQGRSTARGNTERSNNNASIKTTYPSYQALLTALSCILMALFLNTAKEEEGKKLMGTKDRDEFRCGDHGK
jgi:hypothetical protein